mmetsp:Transcript_37661/g.117776  ORF Transcript_37661/g.117776 Transcript_37661/m.117776 type:complete len:243 (+) Transcript_37661:272-1000(+)
MLRCAEPRQGAQLTLYYSISKGFRNSAVEALDALARVQEVLFKPVDGEGHIGNPNALVFLRPRMAVERGDSLGLIPEALGNVSRGVRRQIAAVPHELIHIDAMNKVMDSVCVNAAAAVFASARKAGCAHGRRNGYGMLGLVALFGRHRRPEALEEEAAQPKPSCAAEPEPKLRDVPRRHEVELAQKPNVCRRIPKVCVGFLHVRGLPEQLGAVNHAHVNVVVRRGERRSDLRKHARVREHGS